LYTQLGAALRYRHYVTDTWTFITPELNVAWRHDYLDNSFALKSRLADGSGNFQRVDGIPGSADWIIPAPILPAGNALRCAALVTTASPLKLNLS